MRILRNICGLAMLIALVCNTNELSLIMVGDALLHKSVYEDAKNNAAKNGNGEYDFMPMLENMNNVKKYDLAFYNQETILGGKELGLSTYPAFNSPQEFGLNMLSLGFNLVSLANNHTLDRGEKAIENSLRFWRDKEALSAGSYENFTHKNTPNVREKNGIKYTMLAYTYGTNGIPLPKGKEYLVNVYTKQMLENDIKKVRDKVDFLMVSMHWGIEYEFMPSSEQKELAKYLASLGVDLIIGTHPHVVQPIEWIGDTLVIYSLGNFLSGQRDLHKQIGLVSAVTIKKLKEGKVKISDVKTDLIYTYSKNFKQFKLYYFNQLNENLLPNYKRIYKEYMGIVTAYEKNIKQGNL